MDIKTQIDRITGEVSDQKDLIAEIKTVLAGKAAGGGGGGGDPTLPEGYVRCGYIEFNDAQIVDTGLIGNQDTKIKSVFTRESDAGMYLYGCASNGNTASLTAYLSSGGGWRFGSKSASRTLTVSEDLIHTAIHSKAGVVAVNPNNTYSGVTDFETVGSILIGSARNGDGTVGVASYVGKLLLFEVWQGDEEAQRLVPVVSLDGVYRLYDEVAGAFHDSITDTPLGGGNL